MVKLNFKMHYTQTRIKIQGKRYQGVFEGPIFLLPLFNAQTGLLMKTL